MVLMEFLEISSHALPSLYINNGRQEVVQHIPEKVIAIKPRGLLRRSCVCMCVSVCLCVSVLSNQLHFWWRPSLWAKNEVVRIWEKSFLGKDGSVGAKILAQS